MYELVQRGKALSEDKARNKSTSTNNILETDPKITEEQQVRVEKLNKLIEDYEDLERRIQTSQANLDQNLYDPALKTL